MSNIKNKLVPGGPAPTPATAKGIIPKDGQVIKISEKTKGKKK